MSFLGGARQPQGGRSPYTWDPSEPALCFFIWLFIQMKYPLYDLLSGNHE